MSSILLLIIIESFFCCCFLFPPPQTRHESVLSLNFKVMAIMKTEKTRFFLHLLQLEVRTLQPTCDGVVSITATSVYVAASSTQLAVPSIRRHSLYSPAYITIQLLTQQGYSLSSLSLSVSFFLSLLYQHEDTLCS